ncbi:MAG: MetQ/NlpA family ABC transporter substrate-binding protein [Synergistaceae bacterium]|nr:MetQ/NlpA family ABC transporter substrate-binding protein [Synergistaceae bacterium]MBQ6435100.1 MetQ/NlpA family ABC transporter substrate-binding protein [Synergistaceae bacterium]MBQ6738187.1 MetQ/NlpA family ABC transporter substrate-binding protein [Synergistaceae bacterium]MBR0076624.1 MetQ/NlpA family ABC transporter substrate-binding protein [Synergistaceae bacterium]MBR0080986.1 MetQ/NlpA family ABC transporter substrate-binding protein [Synergistaceae bacterium]
MKKFLVALVLVLSFVSFAFADVTVRLGVTGSVYDEMWQPVKEMLAKEGINLEVIQFSDYVTPNRALADGDIDLNGFQHQIYFADELESRGYKLTNIANTFVVPLNMYSRKIKTVDEIKDGDVIAIPNDPTNGGRAIKVLATSGLITLKEGAGFNPAKEDIETYNKKITIQELAANAIPAALPDVAAGIINDTYALDNGFKASDAVFEDLAREHEYWNLIAARTSDLEDPAKVEIYSKIVDAYHSETMKKHLSELYGGFFRPVGWDEDLLAPFKK